MMEISSKHHVHSAVAHNYVYPKVIYIPIIEEKHTEGHALKYVIIATFDLGQL